MGRPYAVTRVVGTRSPCSTAPAARTTAPGDRFLPRDAGELLQRHPCRPNAHAIAQFARFPAGRVFLLG
jgi:hypothetical protein